MKERSTRSIEENAHLTEMLGEFFFFSEFIKEDMSDLLIPCASTACYFYHKTGETINSCDDKLEYIYVLLSGQVAEYSLKSQINPERRKGTKQALELKNQIKELVAPKSFSVCPSTSTTKEQQNLIESSIVQNQQNLRNNSSFYAPFSQQKRKSVIITDIKLTPVLPPIEIIHIRRKTRGDTKSIFSFPNDDYLKLQRTINVLDLPNLIKKVKQIEKGQGFERRCGQNILVQFFCEEDCHLVRIESDIYQKVLALRQERRKYNLAAFLRKQALFQNFSQKFLFSLFEYTVHLKFTRGETVFREGDLPKYVYVIKKGDFAIFKWMDVASNAKEIKKTKKQKKDEFPLLHHQTLQKKDVKLTRLGEEEMIGETDLVERISRQFSLKCESIEGELIAIDKQFLESKFTQFKDTLADISLIRQNKKSIINRKIEEISQQNNPSESLFHPISPRESESKKQEKEIIYSQITPNKNSQIIHNSRKLSPQPHENKNAQIIPNSRKLSPQPHEKYGTELEGTINPSTSQLGRTSAMTVSIQRERMHEPELPREISMKQGNYKKRRDNEYLNSLSGKTSRAHSQIQVINQSRRGSIKNRIANISETVFVQEVGRHTDNLMSERYQTDIKHCLKINESPSSRNMNRDNKQNKLKNSIDVLQRISNDVQNVNEAQFFETKYLDLDERKLQIQNMFAGGDTRWKFDLGGIDSLEMEEKIKKSQSYHLQQLSHQERILHTLLFDNNKIKKHFFNKILQKNDSIPNSLLPEAHTLQIPQQFNQLPLPSTENKYKVISNVNSNQNISSLRESIKKIPRSSNQNRFFKKYQKRMKISSLKRDLSDSNPYTVLK